MKKAIVIFLTFVSVATYGQKASPSSLDTGNQKDRIVCKHLEVMRDNKTILLRENVQIETKDLVLKADSAVFNKENQTLIAYGAKEFTFNGGQVVLHENTKNTIRYKLKDKTIYIE